MKLLMVPFANLQHVNSMILLLLQALAEATFLKKQMYYNMRIKTLHRHARNIIRLAAEGHKVCIAAAAPVMSMALPAHSRAQLQHITRLHSQPHHVTAYLGLCSSFLCAVHVCMNLVHVSSTATCTFGLQVVQRLWQPLHSRLALAQRDGQRELEESATGTADRCVC